MGVRARAFVRVLLLFLVFFGGFVGAARVPSAEAQGVSRVPVLVYHAVDYSGSAYSVTPEQLAEQCRWLLDNGYTAITVGEFWAGAQGYAKLPPNPIVLTNDDGWPSAMTFADILGQHGMVGTYFVNNTSPLAPDQIASLAARGEVEAHTVSHAAMSGLGYDGQLAEIAGNKTYLEGITGQPVQFLAWPFGDWNESAVQAAAAAGIVGAFGLGGTAAQIGAIDPYHVPRLTVGVDTDITTFAAMVLSW